jgi:hypothetical protein
MNDPAADAEGPAVDPIAATLPPRDGAVTITPAPAPPAPVAPTVPGYEIVRELGRGGMGVVYEARQVGLNRTVALKMILAGGHASAGDVDRFRTEAEAVGRLLHPNIVQVYETGTNAGLPYFSLEFCPGGSLDRKLDGTPWEPMPAAALIETLARAIQHAHDRGIVHRDLKPANVLLSADGTPKVTDFGLAKRLDSDAGPTRTGAGFGTPSYMAPEQADACKTAGPAADTYALGAVLYELLTARPPFKAANWVDTVLQVVSDDPVPPTRLNPKTPRDLETICLKCLAKEPAKRYESAAALAEDLRRFQANEPITARPAGVWDRAAKWSGRNPLAAAWLLATPVMLLIGPIQGIVAGCMLAATTVPLRSRLREVLLTSLAGAAAVIALRWYFGPAPLTSGPTQRGPWSIVLPAHDRWLGVSLVAPLYFGSLAVVVQAFWPKFVSLTRSLKFAVSVLMVLGMFEPLGIQFAVESSESAGSEAKTKLVLTVLERVLLLGSVIWRLSPAMSAGVFVGHMGRRWYGQGVESSEPKALFGAALGVLLALWLYQLVTLNTTLELVGYPHPFFDVIEGFVIGVGGLFGAITVLCVRRRLQK